MRRVCRHPAGDAMDKHRRQRLIDYFRHFAEKEAPHVSPLYAKLAAAVAADEWLLNLAARTRPGQPPANMLFGAVHELLLRRHRGDPLAAYYPSIAGTEARTGNPALAFRRFCGVHEETITGIIRSRVTNTNEVRRAAVVLPGLMRAAAALEAKPFVIELGASIGLTLAFDSYRYAYRDENGESLAQFGDADAPLTLECTLKGDGRPDFLPAFPALAGRVGIELHPVDIHDRDTIHWLRALVWPEQLDRAERLMKAVEHVRAATSRPEIIAGDVADRLPDAIARAPADAPLIVFHTYAAYQFSHEAHAAVTGHLKDAAATRPVMRLAMEWSMEGNDLTLHDVAAGTAERLGFCDPHGAWLEWRPHPLDPSPENP
jgi:hypothetical protein